MAGSRNASSIMTENVITVHPSDSLQTAQSLMKRYRITRVVVVDEKEKAVSILTQKDFVRALSDDKTGREINDIPTSEVMTKKLITVTPETDVAAAARTMLKQNIGSLVVVDGEGKPQGIITKTDLCLWRSKNCPRILKAKHIMTQNVVKVKPTAFVFQVLDLMIARKIHRIVVAEDNEPAGIITVSDLTPVAAIMRPMTTSLPSAAWAVSASDIMTANPLVVKTDDDLCEAMRIMLANRISGLLVVNEKGKLRGILTKTDIVKAIADMT